MSGNTFGKIYRLTSFGESHGTAVGGVIDGCPSGYEIDPAKVQYELERRKPGQSKITSPRKEYDEVEFLSGIFLGKSLGTPIGFLIRNKDSKPEDYKHYKDVYRPSHADYTYAMKYGFRDHRGGGRQSARETIARVVAGAVAKQVLESSGIQITAYTSQVGEIKVQKHYSEMDLTQIENNIVRCPDLDLVESMIQHIIDIRTDGDSVGGVITCVIKNVPIGLGEPVFDKLHSRLGKAMLSINAVKGFEYGSGFEAAQMRGSAHNDIFYMENGKVRTKTNFSGGIQGGISNGEDIYFRVAFKPVATIMRDQKSLDTDLKETVINPRGRHDPCVIPRAVPIVEAMAAMVMLDFLLLSKTK